MHFVNQFAGDEEDQLMICGFSDDEPHLVVAYVNPFYIAGYHSTLTASTQLPPNSAVVSLKLMSPNLTGKNACYQPNKMSTKFKLETHCA